MSKVVYEFINVKQHKHNNCLKSILLIGKHQEEGLQSLRPAKIGLSFEEKGPSRVTGASLVCGQGVNRLMSADMG